MLHSAGQRPSGVTPVFLSSYLVTSFNDKHLHSNKVTLAVTSQQIGPVPVVTTVTTINPHTAQHPAPQSQHLSRSRPSRRRTKVYPASK